MRASTPLLAAISLFSATLPASADLKVDHANYAAGVLVVRGQASAANDEISLDNRYNTTANENKDFQFRVRYLPRGCTVTIADGANTRAVPVSNCDRSRTSDTPTDVLGRSQQRDDDRKLDSGDDRRGSKRPSTRAYSRYPDARNYSPLTIKARLSESCVEVAMALGNAELLAVTTNMRSMHFVPWVAQNSPVSGRRPVPTTGQDI